MYFPIIKYFKKFFVFLLAIFIIYKLLKHTLLKKEKILPASTKRSIQQQTQPFNESVSQSSLNDSFFECKYYKHNCLRLFRDIRLPNGRFKYVHAIAEPPENMMNSDMPLVNLWYFDDLDPMFRIKNKTKLPVDAHLFDKYRKQVSKNDSVDELDLKKIDIALLNLFKSYEKFIDSRSILVMSCLSLWAEALAYEIGASQITTLALTHRFWHEPKLVWHYLNDYLDILMKKRAIEQFDNAVSFSFIDHSGLGRFGEPLSPEGDLMTMKQLHCMLKPEGLLFLGPLEMTNKEKSELYFNAKRVYGQNRLQRLLNGWQLVEYIKETNFYVLKKKTC